MTRRLAVWLSCLLAISLHAAERKHIVLISGDEEYRSEELLPQLAKILATHHGFQCTVLFAIDPKTRTIDPNQLDNIPGLEALDTADLMVIMTRFRDLPDDQMKHIVNYVNSGKPIVGLRTATHAFQLKSSPTYAQYSWKSPEGGFGRMVLGETWIRHHGDHGKQSTMGVLNPKEISNPILTGIHDGELWSKTDVYEANLPLPGDSKTLVFGQVLSGMSPKDAPVAGAVNDPMMPIAWVKSYTGNSGKTARVFATTLGTSEDLLTEANRRLLVNACYWALGLESQIKATSDVGLVGEYHPHPFGFGGYVKGLRPQQTSAEELFNNNCVGCHGQNGRGTAKGPGLVMNPRVGEQSAEQLSAFLDRGNLAAGMPSFSDLSSNDRTALAEYLLHLNAGIVIRPIAAAEPTRRITWGAPRAGDWLSYNGNDSGNRYSPLKQIDTSNVSSLKLKWMFPIQSFGLETTPLAADGVVYVTGPNQVFALDALTGSPLWRYARPPSFGTLGDSKLGTNRGVAILRDKVFFVTDNAHLLALDRARGKLLWEIPLAPDGEGQHYGGTMAPLIVHDMVIAGVSGADEGIRGFLAAFKPENGDLIWRHWTVPAAPVTGGGSTWLTGSYDPASDTLYWPTGNPWPDDEDRSRPGDDLYTDCILALNPRTGELKWHYEFTPHDVMDRDSTEPNVLVDTAFQGKPSKLLLHADRNGFFYVIDRSNGEVFLAKPFLRRVDWASSIGSDGRPVVKDPEGCPSDAANWSSTAFSPQTRLYYVMALEECVGDKPSYPDQKGQRFLRALNIDTGQIAWEIPQPGNARAKTWSGVLATAGGLIFYGRPNGGFTAVDQRNGKTLWEFPTNVFMKASPMTFAVNGSQYVAVAAGPNILCFGL